MCPRCRSNPRKSFSSGRVSTYCKECSSKNHAAYYQRHKAKILPKLESNRIKKTYGLTPYKYKKMFEDQQGLCAICRGTTKYKLNVDHDHITGKVRALLCNSCNQGLGYLQESPELLTTAINYLKFWK